MHTTPNADDCSSPEYLTFLRPERAAARAIAHIERNEVSGGHQVNREAVAELLEIECKAVAEGDMTMVRRTIASQVRVLERLYDHLVDRAMATGASAYCYEIYLKLAFRAQSQLNRALALLERYTVLAFGKFAQKTKPEQQHRTPVGGKLMARVTEKVKALRKGPLQTPLTV